MKLTYKNWIDFTKSTRHGRGKELLQIDEAFLAYENKLKSSKFVLTTKNFGAPTEGNSGLLANVLIGSDSSEITKLLITLDKKLEAWKNAQRKKHEKQFHGQSLLDCWENSVRNEKGAITLLDEELDQLVREHRVNRSKKEIETLKFLKTSIKQTSQEMFSRKLITLKKTALIGGAIDCASQSVSFAESIKNIIDPKNINNIKSVNTNSIIDYNKIINSAKELLCKIFKVDIISKLHGIIGGEFIENFLKSIKCFASAITPFLSPAVSIVNAFKNWGAAVIGIYNREQIENGANSFAPGDPSAALNAVIEIQNRQINEYSILGSIHGISAVFQGIFAVVDFGTISGVALNAAKSLSLLMHKIYIYARDYDEITSANEILKKGPFDFSLFKTCPLLGCYLIANANTSHIINMAVSDYGSSGWMILVESMVGKAEPAIKKARDIIINSRYEIKDCIGMKGLVNDATKTTIGIPTGELGKYLKDIENKINH